MSGVRVARRLLGLILVAFAILPLYRVLEGRETGLAGAATAQIADAFTAFNATGMLVIALCAVLAARFIPHTFAGSALARLAAALERPSTLTWALLCGLSAGILAAAFVLFALRGQPNQLDALTQLLHARFLAEGRLAGPVDGTNMFWHIQNSVLTTRGWVSQYPPGHALLLAAGIRSGVPWLVGPLMTFAMVVFSALAAERLLPERIAVARAGALLVALSPFVVCLGGSFMNHVSAGAFLAACVYCVARAAQGAPAWALGAGVAAGAAFTVRPLTALAISSAVMASAWLANVRTRAAGARAAGLAARACAGALPLVIAIGVYNLRVFGHPARFGYDAALGPATGLGFGRDPWGNVYGAIEAFGYTSAELIVLGSALLETPVSLVLVAGAYMMLARTFVAGEHVLAAWALAPIAANAFYWHHGMYMGPRMLFESAPAWILLAVSGAAAAYRIASERRPRPQSAFSLRSAVTGAAACSLGMGLLWLGPQRAAAHATPAGSVAAVRPPAVDGPALVFVHDAWTARLAMQLAGRGMRLDSVETALRQNPTCDVQRLVDAMHEDDAMRQADALARLDLEPRAARLPSVARISAGNTIRVAADGQLPPDCAGQAHADRHGVLDLAPLVWRGDLPGGVTHGALFVRDLGPLLNVQLIERMPDRVPYLLHTTGDDAVPRLTEYATGMALLWGPQIEGVVAVRDARNGHLHAGGR